MGDDRVRDGDCDDDDAGNDEAYLSNVALFGAKRCDLFGGMIPEVRPDCWCIAEAHLRGTDLNAARRRLKKFGWRSFATPGHQQVSQRDWPSWH